MNHWILFCFLLAAAKTASPQIKDFKVYQTGINKAELQLSKGEKDKALDSYYSTLHSSDGNFAKDIYNALLLSKDLGKTDTFFSLLGLLKFKNFSDEYLNSLKEFTEFHADPRWQAFLETNNSIIYIDTALRSQMDALHFRDQQFRSDYNRFGDTIRAIDKINIQLLIWLMTEKGLPGEKEIGARDIKGLQGYDIVLHHWAQHRSLDKLKPSLTGFLEKAVLQGRIQPNKAMEYLELQNDGIEGGSNDIVRARFDTVITHFYAPAYSPESREKINSYRSRLSLETLDEYYEKVRFFLRSGKGRFLMDIPINTFNMSRKEDLDMFMRTSAGVDLGG